MDHSSLHQDTENHFQLIDQFDDIKILPYRFDEFKNLPLKQKKLIYYFTKAALAGRDIIYDQNFKHNLLIKNSLELIYDQYPGDRNNTEFTKFHTYLKKFWFSNGIHEPYSKEKLQPYFSKDYLGVLIHHTFDKGLDRIFSNVAEAEQKLSQLLFNKNVAPVGVTQDAAKDMILNSSVNFYEDITQDKAENYYNEKYKKAPEIQHGLNSKLITKDGHIEELVWHEEGMYGTAIRQITQWLEIALPYIENENQAKWLKSLIQYYRTGDLNKFNSYNIHWVKDTNSHTDLINGFIETYSDPLGIKGTWESIVHVRDTEATRRTRILSDNAQWFEDHAPVDDQFKKNKVTGISANVVNVAILGGESYPTSPIGVNLPNADWIRKEHGSKSITLNNISLAHHKAMVESGFIEEFAYSDDEITRNKKYGFMANNLHTDLHECLGHGSGKLLEGIKAEMLKNYQAPIEEARADLFALYYMMDEKLLDLGIMPSLNAAKAQYESYIRNGLLSQLVKVKEDKNLEQAHMRNRQLISLWCYEKGKNENIIEKKEKGGKTFFVVNNFKKLQELFGKLLNEIQRIKSEGDYASAKSLVENYGTKVDKELHREVIQRFAKLKIPPFTGFINPEYKPEYNADGEITDIEITYPENYSQQMLDYSKNYSFLPVDN